MQALSTIGHRDDTDLVIVGAGIIGTLIAHLASLDSPARRITLIDALEPGRQTTGRSAGLMTRWGATEEVRQLAARSAEIYTEQASRGELDGFGQQPLLWSMPHAFAETWASCHPNSLRRVAPETIACSIAIDMRDRVVYADQGHVLAASHAVSGLIDRLRQRGAHCWQNVRVQSLALDGARVHVSLSDGSALWADHCALATGPWLELARGLVPGVEDIRIKRVVSIHYDVAPRAGEAAILFPDRDAFLLPLHHQGRWLFSYRSEVWDEHPDEMQEHVTADDMAAARDILEMLAPELAVHAVGGQVFCDGYPPLRTPQVLAAAGDAPLVMVTGGSGSGVRLAPALAERALHVLYGDPS